jgi:hypothetical protein
MINHARGTVLEHMSAMSEAVKRFIAWSYQASQTWKPMVAELVIALVRGERKACH